MIAGFSCGSQIVVEFGNFSGLSCSHLITQIKTSDDDNCKESVVEVALAELLEEALGLCFVQWVFAAVQHWIQIFLDLLNLSRLNSVAVNAIDIDFIWVQVDVDAFVLHMVVDDVLAAAVAFVQCLLALIRVSGDAFQHFPLINEVLFDGGGHVINWSSIGTEDGDKANS